MADSVVGDQFSAEGDGKRASWEGAGGDRILQEVEGAAETLFLRAEVAHQEGEACGRILGGGQSRFGGLIGL